MSYCGASDKISLELGMDMMVKVFEKHARKGGDKFHLSRRELRDLFHEDLRNLIQKTSRDPEKFAEIVAGLDENLDGLVDFEEFASMAARLIVFNHPYFFGARLMYGYK